MYVCMYVCMSFLMATLFFFQQKYVINSLDDNVYAFIASEGNGGNIYNVLSDDYPRSPIQSVADAISSQSQHYFTTNGRFLAHVIVQSISGLMSMKLFSYLLSFFYFGLIFVFFLLIGRKEKWHLSNLLLFVLGFAFLIPVQGLVFFNGIAASINYLLGGVLVLYWYYFFCKIVDKDKAIPIPLVVAWIAYSFIVGAFQESFSLALSGALFFYYFFNYRKISIKVIYSCLPFFLGTLTLLLAPANFNRFESNGGIGVHWNFLIAFISIPSFISMVLSLAYIFAKDKNVFSSTIKENFIFLLTIAFNFIFCLFIAYIGRHQLFCISIFSLLITYRIWFRQFDFNRLNIHYAVYPLFVLFIVGYTYTLNLRKDLYLGLKEIENQVHHHNRNIDGEKYYHALHTIENNSILQHNYITTLDIFSSEGVKKSFSIKWSKGENSQLLKHLFPLSPQAIKNSCIAKNQYAKDLFMVDDRLLVSKKLENGEEVHVLTRNRIPMLNPVPQALHGFLSYTFEGEKYTLYRADNLLIKE
ncbi:DUF6056 family protein [Ornithobacterium rhinotracheale]